MSILPLDIEGLDLVLGGGIHLLERVSGSGESAILLIRGPAGSGKTAFGTQLAASIARALQTDVAYGCVELLPTELRAQHEGIRKPTSREEVVILTEEIEETGDPDASSVRIFAGVLDLGEDGESVKHFGAALEGLLEEATRRAGRKVRVLVADSLADGYGLGANAPRILADGVSKLAAEQGLVVVLLEELSEARPSVWSFAVDTVLELSLSKENKFPGRELSIPKNRMGPSNFGPHELDVAHQRGAALHPHESAYVQAWPHSVFTPPDTPPRGWSPRSLASIKWLPAVHDSVVTIIGRDAALNKRMAFGISDFKDLTLNAPVDLVFLIGAYGLVGFDSSAVGGNNLWITAWHPVLSSGPRILSLLRSWLSKAKQVKRPLRRVIVGDLRDIERYTEAHEKIAAISTISVMAVLMRSLRIPLILFETIEQQHVRPVSASIADVVLNVEVDGSVRVSHMLGMEERVNIW